MIAFFSSLPPEHFSLLRLVADEASARGVAAYVVGGFVRDLILKRPGLDFDIVVEGDAPALARALAKKHGGKVTAHTRFHTATWFLSTNYQFTKSRSTNLPPFLDLITARRESYARPGSLPDVTPSTIDDDLRRRDFTINTLAVRLDGAHFGELYDPQHGAADIEDGIIRVLHDASFSDDPTRILRAVRYEQRYGFQIEAHTLGLLPASRALLGQLSAERARHELDLILEEPRAAAMLARLEELGLLKAVAGQLPWNANISRRLDSVVDAIPTLDWKIGEPRSDIPMRRVLGYSLWLMDLAPDAI
jgi:tRNA nucleotidyltransferase (CCA-adding enzyme)